MQGLKTYKLRMKHNSPVDVAEIICGPMVVAVIIGTQKWCQTQCAFEGSRHLQKQIQQKTQGIDKGRL